MSIVVEGTVEWPFQSNARMKRVVYFHRQQWVRNHNGRLRWVMMLFDLETRLLKWDTRVESKIVEWGREVVTTRVLVFSSRVSRVVFEYGRCSRTKVPTGTNRRRIGTDLLRMMACMEFVARSHFQEWCDRELDDLTVRNN